MDNPTRHLIRRSYSPFDDSAVERIRRMGLISETDRPDRDAISVLSCVYAGQYFDDLCDFCQDPHDVSAILVRFLSEAEQADPKERFLQICLLYDAIYRSIPDPIWWISGNLALAELFSIGFISRLQHFKETFCGEGCL